MFRKDWEGPCPSEHPPHTPSRKLLPLILISEHLPGLSIRPGCAARDGCGARGARQLGAISAHCSRAPSSLVSPHYQPAPRQAASTLGP